MEVLQSAVWHIVVTIWKSVNTNHRLSVEHYMLSSRTVSAFCHFFVFLQELACRKRTSDQDFFFIETSVETLSAN